MASEAKNRIKLTESLIERQRVPATGEIVLRDSLLPQLVLRVFPSGTKRFYCVCSVRYRDFKRALGEWPLMRVAAAREAALELLRALERGEDPSQKKKAELERPTLADFYQRYDEYAAAHLKQRSRDEYERLFAKEIEPRLGKLKVAEIDRQHAQRLHHAMRETPTMANRALAVLSAVLAHAEAVGERPPASNPCRGIRKFKEASRDRFLSPAELKRLGDVLAVEDVKGGVHSVAVGAVRLLLLSGCRREEIMNLKWSDVDLRTGTLWLRDSKTGKRSVVLNSAALEVVKSLPRSSEWVFPGKIAGHRLAALIKFWHRYRVAAGIEDVRLHDLRHSYASVGAMGGESLLVIGKLLGHREAATTQKYSHLADDPLRKASDRIGNTLQDLMRTGGAEVVEVAPSAPEGRKSGKETGS